MRSLGRNWNSRSPKSYEDLRGRDIPTNPSLEAERERRQEELRRNQDQAQVSQEATSANG